jgi:hypothetical protein
MIKSKRIASELHVERMEETRNTYKILVNKCEGKNNTESQEVHGRIILKWTSLR